MKSNTTRIFLSLGSNLGDREKNLKAIHEALPPKVRLSEVSSIYETAPWGSTNQTHFSNQVVEAAIDLNPLPLLRYVKAIERSIGRKPSRRFGSCLADIDILFCGDEIIQTQKLTNPHPRTQDCTFVLGQQNEIAANLFLPGTEQTISEVLSGMDIEGIELYQG